MVLQSANVTLKFDDSIVREARRRIREGIQMARDGLNELEAAMDSMPVTAEVPPPPPPTP
jgi:hypothetical protein